LVTGKIVQITWKPQSSPGMAYRNSAADFALEQWNGPLCCVGNLLIS
jgi:hypothetical protein